MTTLCETDKNTVKYMVVKQQETIDELNKAIEDKDASMPPSQKKMQKSPACIDS